MTDGQLMHSSLFILQINIRFHFHMRHTNKTEQEYSQYCTKLHNEVHNVLHNKTYWKLKFSVCIGFVKQRKNKFYILN